MLAALYESWTLPLAVILIVPMTMLSALFGVWLTGGDNNVFVQVGLVVLMGLGLLKNAILIVEFARELEIQGKGIMEAALEACRLRLRPIVMTSIAFIAGTIPLILGHGAGAEDARRHRDHGVLRDAGRDALRSVPDAGVLRDATETGDPQEAGPGGSARLACSR
ncbi:efflux RND transporter permease subunit [Klebsiella pneumoniae]